MCVAEVTVGLSDEDAAVLVTNLFGDDFEIGAGFDGVADEIVAEAVAGELRKLCEFAAVTHGAADGFNF